MSESSATEMREFRIVGYRGRRWILADTEPCPWCDVWIGPHRHMLNGDGSIGIIIESVEPGTVFDVDKIRSALGDEETRSTGAD